MKRLWKMQAQRIDALSLRERVIMFASIALALGALVDALVLSPALGERKLLASQLREETAANEQLRRGLDAGPAGTDATPQGRQRAALAALRSESALLEAEIRTQLAGRGDVTQLPQVVDRLLRRHDRLALVKLEAVAENAVVGNAVAGNAVAGQADGGGLAWHGVELGVTGTYPALVDYLADLERSLPGVRWGELHLSAADRPPLLTVRLMLPKAR